jgi:hypothetical protein
MKNYYQLLILVIAFSCKPLPKNATFMSEDIYLVFPDTLVESRQYAENMVIYATMNDSIECKATLAEGDKNMHADSVSKIQGIDANIYKFVETQLGYDLVAKDTLIDGKEAISFSYINDFRGSTFEFNNNGYIIYHDSLMILVEYSNRSDLEDLISPQRAEFLQSIRIK